jgi:hypothetical protein
VNYRPAVLIKASYICASAGKVQLP